jgi:hypothetical protein
MIQRMLLALLFVAACQGPIGPAGPAGPQGEQGPAGHDGADGTNGVLEAALLGVNPFFVYQDTAEVVNIQGIGTNWTDGSVAVHFGPGVTVDTVTVASSVSLLVGITVAEDAPTGPRDVEVTSGSTTVTWTGAFEVKPSVEITLLGNASQGSLFQVKFEQRNPDAPAFSYYDTLTVPDGMNAREYTYDYNNNTVTFDVSADVDAEPGSVPVTLNYGSGSQDPKAYNTSFELTARNPEPLPLGTTTSDVLAADGDTHLYEIQTPGTVDVLTFNLVADQVCTYYYYGSTYCPQWAYQPGATVYVLDESGSWDNRLYPPPNYGYYSYGTAVIESDHAQTLYVVVVERRNVDVDVNYDITVDESPPFDPANDITVTWDPGDTGGQVHVDVANSGGGTQFYFGMAETAAGVNGYYDEDCQYHWTNNGYYPLCHYSAYPTMHADLTYVETRGSVYSGYATLFDDGTDGDYDAHRATGRDRLTYYLQIYGGLNSGQCWTWGDDTTYYTNYWPNCTAI